MATTTTEYPDVNVSEGVAMLVGLTSTGEVKMMRAVAGDANDERTMAEIARPMIGRDGITSAAILPAHYIFTLKRSGHLAPPSETTPIESVENAELSRPSTTPAIE